MTLSVVYCHVGTGNQQSLPRSSRSDNDYNSYYARDMDENVLLPRCQFAMIR